MSLGLNWQSFYVYATCAMIGVNDSVITRNSFDQFKITTVARAIEQNSYKSLPNTDLINIFKVINQEGCTYNKMIL
tara:strand:- start:912 stop:1139 length:228 start_codon:yes stop_codon:yes gene_type:complete